MPLRTGRIGLIEGPNSTSRKGILQMQLSHTRPVRSAVFDDPNLVSSAGLVPMLVLARSAGLARLADQHLSVPTDKGANAGLKVASLVAGMVAGADSIDDMAVLRHGGMGKVFTNAYAPSTLGSFLRSFTFGHVRQLDAVAARFLTGLAAATPLVAGVDDYALVDIDDTIIEVHGYGKQGSGYGYSGVRGLNALIATLTTNQAAPVIVAQRLRKGSCGSPRGAKRLVTDALATVKKLRTGPAGANVLLRADSAFYGHGPVGAAVRAGAQVSVTVRLDPKVKAAIAAIDDHAWAPIQYTDAIFDQATQEWISAAEVAEIPFTAFAAQKKANQIPGRLVVRRIPDLNPHTGQATLFDTWRFHAFFTTSTLDTVAAVGLVRGHGVQGAGGEGRVEPPGLEQGCLPGVGVQVGDPAHDEPPGYLVGLLLRGERGEPDLGDLRGRDPHLAGVVEDCVRVLDGLPRVIGDGGDGRFHSRVQPDSDRDLRTGADRGTDPAVSVERRVRAQQDLGSSRAGAQFPDRGQRVRDQAFGASR